MADESVENRDPRSERSVQAPRDGENEQSDRPSNRRRIIIASLLTPPAVMTLKARSAHAASGMSSAAPSARPAPGKAGKHKG
jgi:hypothetical protein